MVDFPIQSLTLEGLDLATPLERREEVIWLLSVFLPYRTTVRYLMRFNLFIWVFQSCLLRYNVKFWYKLIFEKMKQWACFALKIGF